ncbi:MAG: thymidylate synthase [Bacteroidota bacterium]|nr:thymidylate synthase [Bacteroidota bacterium]
MNNIPVLTVSGESLAVTYEAALVKLYNEGTRFKTQYDKPGDPLSIDCTLNATVLNPECDPMIHQAFPGGIDELKEYVMELKGFKDHWVKNMNDPEDTRWEYTYHGRLQRYGSWKERVEENGNLVRKDVGFQVDQVEHVIQKLVEQPYTRQAQMITWMPNHDLHVYDPPCLQSLWYRIMEDEKGIQWLNCNIRFRSNDAWGASFMNMFGFIRFNREVIADEVARRSGREVHLGRMNWQADSYHIYGRDIAQAKAMLFDRIDSMSLEERTFNFGDDFIREMYDQAEQAALMKIRKYDEEHAH